MRVFSLFGRPAFLRNFHKWATVLWLIASVPLALVFGESVIFVSWLSLYAVVVGHWSSFQASAVEVKQDEAMEEAR